MRDNFDNVHIATTRGWERHEAIGFCDGDDAVACGDGGIGGGSRGRGDRRGNGSPRPVAGGKKPRGDHRCGDRGADRCAARADDDRAKGRSADPGRHQHHHAQGSRNLSARLDPRGRQQRPLWQRKIERRRLGEAGRRISRRVAGAAGERHRHPDHFWRRCGARAQQRPRCDAVSAQYRTGRGARPGADPAHRGGHGRRNRGKRHRMDLCADARGAAGSALGPQL